jgi:hypothetical protein
VINCHKMQVKEGRGAGEAEQSRPGYGGARRSDAGEMKGRKKEKEAPTGGPQVSATQRKKKRKKRWRTAAGEVKCAAGLLGRKVR